jgi:hypothetical protein
VTTSVIYHKVGLIDDCRFSSSMVVTQLPPAEALAELGMLCRHQGKPVMLHFRLISVDLYVN